MNSSTRCNVKSLAAKKIHPRVIRFRAHHARVKKKSSKYVRRNLRNKFDEYIYVYVHTST